MPSDPCPTCRYASFCLSDPNFKRYIVRCTVCGAFRHYNVLTKTIMELGIPACLSLPRPRKTKCCKCKPGVFHEHVMVVFAKGREAQQIVHDIQFVFFE